MARKRTRNYREMRTEYDEAEGHKEEELEEEEDEDEDEEDEDEEAVDVDDEDEDEDEEDEDGEPKPKKKKKKAPVKEAKPKRARASKANVRMKAVWGVFSNNSQPVAKYPYPQKEDAEAHAQRLREEKNQTFFVQMIKEPMDS